MSSLFCRRLSAAVLMSLFVAGGCRSSGHRTVSPPQVFRSARTPVTSPWSGAPETSPGFAPPAPAYEDDEPLRLNPPQLHPEAVPEPLPPLEGHTSVEPRSPRKRLLPAWPSGWKKDRKTTQLEESRTEVTWKVAGVQMPEVPKVSTDSYTLPWRRTVPEPNNRQPIALNSPQGFTVAEVIASPPAARIAAEPVVASQRQAPEPIGLGVQPVSQQVPERLPIQIAGQPAFVIVPGEAERLPVPTRSQFVPVTGAEKVAATPEPAAELAVEQPAAKPYVSAPAPLPVSVNDVSGPALLPVP